MLVQLYPHQVEGIKWLKNRTNSLLADDMGLGKTCQTLLATSDEAPILVICPAIAKNVWMQETKKFTPNRTSAYLDGRGSFRWPREGEVLAVNFDILPKCEGTPFPKLPAELAATMPKGLVVVIDEAQKIKNPKAKRTQAMRAIGYDARQKGGRVVALTGTPLLNKPPEVWAILVAAGLQFEAFGDFGREKYDRAMELAGGYKDRFGWKFDPKRVSPEFARRLDRVSLRRTKDEVLDLPPKRFNQLSVDVSPGDVGEADEALEILREKGINLKEADLHALMGGISFNLISAARAALAKAKIGAALAVAEDCEENGEIPLFFSAHLAPVEALAAREGWRKITGEESTAQRVEIERLFQSGQLKGLACTIRSSGVALTLTKATRVVFVDQDWTPANNEQATDRAYRIGQTRSILVTTLVANHELDERLAILLAFKKDLANAIVEKAREFQGDKMGNVPPAQKPVPVNPKPVVTAPASSGQNPYDKRSKEGIQWLLINSDRAVMRALVVLWERQTLDEKHGGKTVHNNGIGFNGVDAPFCTSLAEQVRSGRNLSEKQLAAARRILYKYSGQLVAIAAEKT